MPWVISSTFSHMVELRPRSMWSISRSIRKNRLYSTLKNQLGESNNPYLLSHRLNPVAWQQWTPKTLELAKELNKPIFLSIGYHSCHWCHVMNKESFFSEEVASKLNDHFIPIKVDKEEWPDLDHVYMLYLQARHGQGGWPLNVFLTPDSLQPFFGGTYWAGPAAPETTKAAKFLDVIKAVSDQWKHNEDQMRSSAEKISSNLAAVVDSKSSAEGVDLELPTLAAIVEGHLLDAFDKVNGGYTQAPKFVMGSTLRFIFQNAKHLSPEFVASANFTLDKILKGGIKDQVGNGVARYSVSEDWFLPHFEKVLYDQPLLLQAALESNEAPAVELAHDLTDFLISGPLTTPQGTWNSAVDADSLGSNGEFQEGEFYVWTADDFSKALADLPLFDKDMCAMYYGVNDHGNVNPDLDSHGEFTNKNILSVHDSVEAVAKAFGRRPAQVQAVLAKGKEALLKYRNEKKVPPAIDTKVVSGWNGQAIGALARASWKLGRRDALDAAARAAKYLYQSNWDGKELSRTVDEAGNRIPSVNDDYAYLISGLLDLYEASFNIQYLEWATELQAQQIEKFGDPRGGFFTSQNWPWLIFRPKIGFDSAEPSSNAMSLDNLARLGLMTRDVRFSNQADHLADCYSLDLREQPMGYISMLGSLLAREERQYYAILGDVDVHGDGQANAELAVRVREALQAGNSVVKVDKNSIHYFNNYAQDWIDAQDVSFVQVPTANAV